MKIDVKKFKSNLIDFNETGILSNYLGKSIMYLVKIQIKNYKIGKLNDRLTESDNESNVVENVIYRLNNLRAKGAFDFSKSEKELLTYVKGTINYAILTIRRNVFAMNSKVGDNMLGFVESITHDTDKIFLPVFDLALDYRINGKTPLWIGLID